MSTVGLLSETDPHDNKPSSCFVYELRNQLRVFAGHPPEIKVLMAEFIDIVVLQVVSFDE